MGLEMAKICMFIDYIDKDMLYRIILKIKKSTLHILVISKIIS